MTRFARTMARRRVLVAGFALVALAGCGAPSLEKSQWQPVALDGLAQVDLTDLAFSGEQGWLVGSRSTLLTSTDGGSTWKPKPLKLDGDVRFLSVSFSGQEGWICGEPKTLLHTTDGGDSWFRIPLDRRLPGNPMQVSALGPGTMEMVLDSGLVIRTVDGGKKFRVITPASAGGIRAAQRVADGSYWVVSTRGGSYLHWAPGDEQFTNYQRTSSRRIQNMGFSGQRGWMINQGGEMQFSEDGGKTWTPPASVILNGIGLLDAAYDSRGNLWVTGGNGTLIVSSDGGKSWKGDPLGGLKPTLTRVVFFGDRGFALGQNGALFRTQGA